MTDKEMEKIADEIVKEVSMIPDLSEYEAMASCAIRALKKSSNINAIKQHDKRTTHRKSKNL